MKSNMKIRKLLALALTGVTLLSTVPVHAQVTNSIGYTNFLFPEDGNNYFINAEHKFLGNTKIQDDETFKYHTTDIINQEVSLPTNTHVSFDVTSLMRDFDLEDSYIDEENRDYFAVMDLVKYHANVIAEEYDYVLTTTFSDTSSVKPSETATVTFTQDGKQLAKFTLNKNVLADNKHFTFYNKSTSPVKVTVDTDSWFAIDLGYTAHKANKKYITDSNWTFSTKPEKTYIAKVKNRLSFENSYKGAINYISIDNKPATIKIYQKGKLIQTKKVQGSAAFLTKKLQKGNYTIKVSTKSSGYNLIAADGRSYKTTNKGKKSSIKLAFREDQLGEVYFTAEYVKMFFNIVPQKGELEYQDRYGFYKTSKPIYSAGETYWTLNVGSLNGGQGYGIGIYGNGLTELNFDRLKY